MRDDVPLDAPESDRRRELLQLQLRIAWSFGEEVVLPAIDHERCLWAPSGHVVTVHEGPGGWAADWPDERDAPLPQATIGWLLWHVEWWWSNAARAVRDEEPVPPTEYRWSGSNTGVLRCKAVWDELLATADLDRHVTGLMPTPQSVAFVAAWVNFELTKNLSEMNQLIVCHGNEQRR